MFGKIVHRHDIRVIQFRYQAGFALKASSKGGIFSQIWMQYLDSHVTIQTGLICLVHRCHPTLPQFFHDPIRTQIFACGERHNPSSKTHGVTVPKAFSSNCMGKIEPSGRCKAPA